MSTHARNCTNLVRSQSVLRIFIESAAIWVLVVFVTFMVYLADRIAVYTPLFLVRLLLFVPRKAVLKPLATPTTQASPILGISLCMMTVRLQLHSKATVVGPGSGNSRLPYVSNFKTGPRERGAYTADSETAPNEFVVFSSKRTLDESTFDTTASEV